jgi:uncharacterized OB-fold protein
MPTLNAERKIADPVLNPGDQAYFDAAAEGRLRLKSCRACGQMHHFPRAICPFCWSDETDWVDAVGEGTIYTFSVTRRGPGAPYCIAYVTLDEGPVMMTNIVDTDLDAVHIGQRVQVVMKPSEGGMAIPMFTPARSGEGTRP